MAIIESEIKLFKANAADDEGVYPVIFHWQDLGNTSRSPVLGKTSFDLSALAEAPDSDEHGELLAKGLFCDPVVLADFDEARKAAVGASLRIRLNIDLAVKELHKLRWETLRDPFAPYGALTTREQIFLRYLECAKDGRTNEPQARQDLRALVVVANPGDLPRYHLDPIPVQSWVDSIRSDLGDDQVIGVEVMGGEIPATLDNIIATLRRGVDESHRGFDILCLVCYGAMDQDDPRLFLETDRANGATGVGIVADESGKELARRIGELEHRPRLIVLCSCESAGAGGNPRVRDWDMLAALGPLLAAEGIPAVVAMQGKVPRDMAHRFLKTFFEQLQLRGIVDQAMAAARADVTARYPDHYWMPTLYLRLNNGDIRWYTRGFMVAEEFGIWSTIVSNIREQKCTPILGPGLLTPFYGSLRELARRFAPDPGSPFPLANHLSHDLVQVSQYMHVTYDTMLRQNLRRYLCEELIARNKGLVSDELKEKLRPRSPVPEMLLDSLLQEVWNNRRGRFKNDAHQILARFPFPIYLSANPDSLMFHALRQADSEDRSGARKDPKQESWDWWAPRTDGATAQTRAPDYEPSESTPLVYRIFGRLDKWEHVPVTEDDYFAFLLKFGDVDSPIPPDVQRALAEKSLLFLGFQLDDWSFRVLLHALRSAQNVRSGRGVCAAVQVDPDAGQLQDAAGAHKYLEKYFLRKKVIVYWGSTEEFLDKLWKKWEKL